MAIIYNEDKKVFNIKSKNTSYALMVADTGHLIHLYWGRKLESNKLDYIFKKYGKGSFLADTDNIDNFSIELNTVEYPTYGHTDLRSPAIEIKLANGTTLTDFRYENHSIFRGKKELRGLPATYMENDIDGETLEITLVDKLAELRIVLSYTVFEEYDAITRSCRVINNSNNNVEILRVLSANVDFNSNEFDLIQLSGAWARERHMVRTPLRSGNQLIESRRGASSHDQNPFIALASHDANEEYGDVYGLNLIYSGNFLANVEVDMYNNSRAQIGINPFDFSWLLEPNEEFEAPEAVLVYSSNGLTGMSHIFHDLYRKRLCRGVYRDKERPILINNWEATYFNFNGEKIKSIAKDAADLGIELFVLDDGWFGHRNDDTQGLGDWFVNIDKLPHGISGLSKKIHDLGLKFGLWIEPEMVNKDSLFYQEHPHWTLETPQRKSCHGRNQYILDFSNPEVVEEIAEALCKIIDDSYISYIKWDMNRCMSEVYSSIHDHQSQGKVMHKYILGVYRLYTILTEKYPDILFESCASGGARFDPGMLYYAPQCWTSDDTDAIERLKIQYGTSLVYPLSSMGSHVSAIPNHQTFRNTPLETRANVAYFGTFGYELDVNQLTFEEKEIIKKQISFMKQYRSLFQFGTFYRLKSPFTSNETAWMVVSYDKTQAIVGYYRPLQEVNVGYRRLPLLGLDEDKMYHVNGLDLYGDELMNVGLIISDSSCGENKDGCGDYYSKLYILKEAE